tara:strand:- start:714 stop:2339 length:1626 start_codon:yes stop_codon:yes gene_type:complete
MRKRALSILMIIVTSHFLCSQTTYDQVYNIFQTNCAFGYCHSNGSQVAGLDLQGSGANPQSVVWNNLYNADPTNSFAASKGYKRIYPGDPYRSSLFRKINHGMDDFISLDPFEGSNMPSLELKDREKELIRQWILFGSPDTGNVVDTTLIGQYYDGYGVDGITNRPNAPHIDSGFQIKLGPFFLYANDEHEYYYKYPLDNDSIEVNRVFSDLGQTYSHHLIIYRFITPDTSYDYGLREDNAHANVDIVTAHQETETISLPEGTAFAWHENTVLDLNTHYINYHPSKVLKCENYINVYTQPKNTALHEMNSQLHANTLIYIPNDSTDYTFTQPLFDPVNTQNIYVWSMYTHTHQWGKDYDVWMRNPNGSKGDKVYDASFMNGDPNGVQIGYDYQHPPTRRWEYPFLTTAVNEGLIHEAVYNNTGPNDVTFGLTSDDEMMVFVLMYVEDTTGLGNVLSNIPETGNLDIANVYPNPSSNLFHFRLNKIEENLVIKVFDLSGKMLLSKALIYGEPCAVSTPSSGLFIYKIEKESKTLKTGKLIAY